MSIVEYAAAMKAVLFIEKSKSGSVKQTKKGLSKQEVGDLRAMLIKQKEIENDTTG